MRILGVESSCDETAAAIVEDGRKLLGSAIASSAEIHKQYGGVVPEIASRMHVESILPVLSETLKQAGLDWDAVDGIAVTHGPGLSGALLVGLSAAKALALSLQRPLLAVHHIASHIAANYLAFPELKPPFLCLVVSGGHSQLIRVDDYVQFSLLGTTRDDAAGEALDKVARALGLPYPGGPQLDALSQTGDRKSIRFPETRFADGSLDFSFSGVKTAALTWIQMQKQKAQRSGETQFPFSLEDFAAAYQEAVLRPLVRHAEQALESTKLQALVLAGGVSANSRLRELCAELAERKGVRLYCPPLQYCTDNAAMVASMGYYVQRHCPQGWGLQLDAIPQLSLIRYGEEIHARSQRHQNDC